MKSPRFNRSFPELGPRGCTSQHGHSRVGQRAVSRETPQETAGGLRSSARAPCCRRRAHRSTARGAAAARLRAWRPPPRWPRVGGAWAERRAERGAERAGRAALGARSAAPPAARHHVAAGHGAAAGRRGWARPRVGGGAGRASLWSLCRRTGTLPQLLPGPPGPCRAVPRCAGAAPLPAVPTGASAPVRVAAGSAGLGAAVGSAGWGGSGARPRVRSRCPQTCGAGQRDPPGRAAALPSLLDVRFCVCHRINKIGVRCETGAKREEIKLTL